MKRYILLIASTLLLGACATREQANNRLSKTEAPLTTASKVTNEKEILEELSYRPNSEAPELIDQDIAFSTLKDLKDQEDLRTLELELIAPNRMPSQATPLNKKENLSAELFNANTITAQEGDCLTKISKTYLGSSDEWPRIAHLNPQIKDPEQKIAAGEKIYVPALKSFNPQKVSAFHEAPRRGIASVTESSVNEPKPLPFKSRYSKNKSPINDQLKEQLKFAKYKKKKFKHPKFQNEQDREIASTLDDEENDVALNTHQKLSNAIGALGILLMLAVFLSFFISRSEKN
jgi:LysM repeat protein